MKKGRNWVWIMGVVSFLLLIKTPLIYGWELKEFLAPFQFSVSVQEEFNSNIFLTDRAPKHDFITNVSAGLTFLQAEKNYGIDLNFLIGYIFYAKYHDLNYLTIGPSTLNAWYALSPRLTFRVRDYIIRSDEGREQIYSANAQQNQFLLSTVRGEPAIYIRNVFEPSLDYKFGKENLFTILYRNNYYNNQSPRFQNSMENTINPKLTYWFDIHNGVSLDYYFTYDAYEHSPDQFINGVTPRYTYRFDPRTSIFGEYHFEYQDFQSPGIDYYVHNPSLGITYQFTPTLSGLAQVGYYWQIPARGGKSQGPTFNVSLTQNLERTTYTLSFVGGYTEDYVTAQNLGFTKTYALYGTIKHQLTQKMRVGLTGSVERDSYSTERKDWVYGIWGDVSYSILKWLTASLRASYVQDHSTLNAFTYVDYRVILGLTATF